MTAEQVAQSLGVSAETLIQEVISKQTAWHTLCTAVIMIAFLAVAVCFIRMAFKDIDFAGILLPFVVIAGMLLLFEVHEFAAWWCAPETTARSYIAETYGGKAGWK